MNEPQPTEVSLSELRALVRGLAEEVRELRAQLGLLSTEVGWLKGRLAELGPPADLPRANVDSPPARLDAPRTPGDGPLWRGGSAGAFGGRPASPSTLQALRNGEKLNNAIRQRLQAFSSGEVDDGADEIPTDVDVLIDRLHALADGPAPTSHPSPMSPERH